VRAPLVDDGEVGVQAFGEGPRALDAARVGRDDGHVAPPDPPAEVLEQHGGGVDVVDRHVEEALDLAGVQVDRQHARGTGGRDQVGHQLGADRHARRDLPVLAGVAVVGYHCRDAPRRRPFEGVEHQEQLHQVVVAGRAGGLDHEHIAAAHVLGDLDLHLAVAETPDLGLAERHVDVAADRLRQRAVRAPREYLDLVLHRPIRVIPASWAGRSRTFAAGSKVRCLTSLATAHQSPSRVPAKRGMLGSVPFDVNLGLLPPERRGRKTRMLPFERVAHAAAARAGALLRARCREPQEVSFKGDIDLVTATDREAERLIVEAISEAFPEHGIVAEESAPRPGLDGHRWYVDPLDGTTNFAHGYPHFCVSIALARDDDLLLGLVYDPMREETFSALRAGGARLNGSPIGGSDTRAFGRALLGTGFPYDRRQHTDFYLAYLAEALRRTQGVRRGGGAGAWGGGSSPPGGGGGSWRSGGRRRASACLTSTVCLHSTGWIRLCLAGSVWAGGEVDGTSQVPEMQQRDLDPALGLRAGGRLGDLQGVGVHQSRVRLLAARRQGRGHLREEDRAQALIGP